MQILEVIPIAKSARMETLTYFSAKKVTLGQLVKVPLRRQEVLALVVQIEEVRDFKTQIKNASFQIRNILEAYDNSLFSSAFLNTCLQLKDFYLTHTGKIIEHIIPSWILKNAENLSFKRTKNNHHYQSYLLQQTRPERIVYYKSLIREKFTQDESIHIICPTQESVEYLFSLLSKNIEDKCFILHGGITAKKAQITVQKIGSLEAGTVLISTPHFIDIHQHNLGIIIIEEESSEYYFSITSPFIDMRVFIHHYAQQMGISCVSADTIIRPETWNTVTLQQTELIEPHLRKIFKKNDLEIIHHNIPSSKKPTDEERFLEITKKKKFEILTREARNLIKKSIQEKNNIFLFIPKKGLASTIHCNDCGNIARSPSTGHPLSLSVRVKDGKKEPIFIAKMTGEKISAFDTCQFCKGNNLVLLGIGTQTIEQYIHEHFPKAKTIIIDGEHIKTKTQTKEIREHIQNSSQGLVIIGTSKALSFFETVENSIIVSMDSFFTLMNRNITTKILSLITTIIEKTQNPVLFQTKNIISDILPVLNHGVFSEYIEQEIKMSHALSFPPFNTLITLKKELPKYELQKWYQEFSQLFANFNPHIFIEPHPKKSHLSLFVILKVDTSSWNITHQDKKLFSLLSALAPTSDIRVNGEQLIY